MNLSISKTNSVKQGLHWKAHVAEVLKIPFFFHFVKPKLPVLLSQMAPLQSQMNRVKI